MKDLFRIDGEVAVVTGALGKLGPVWVGTLLDGGASVFALDLPQAKISQDYQKLQEHFDESRLMLDRADVRDRGGLEAACQNCCQTLGVPSILVNNAGIDQPPGQTGKGYRLEDIPFEINREILEVNTLGAFLVTQVFGRPMLQASRGSIINIGSLYAGVAPDGRFYDHIKCDPPFLKPPAY